MSFDKINRRLNTALYFHRKQSDVFNFLGLEGFHKMHEHHYWDEAETARKLKDFVITHCGTLLFDTAPDMDAIKFVPSGLEEMKREDLSHETWLEFIKISFQSYLDWESETLTDYEEAAAEFLKAGKIADYTFMSKLISDVSDEKAELTNIILELQGTGYDLPTVAAMQENLVERYEREEERECKCKEKHKEKRKERK